MKTLTPYSKEHSLKILVKSFLSQFLRKINLFLLIFNNCKCDFPAMFSGVLGHQFLQFISVGAHQIGNLSKFKSYLIFIPLNWNKILYLLTIFDENEGRHGRNLIVNGNVFSLINVDFEEFDVTHLSFHFFKHW